MTITSRPGQSGERRWQAPSSTRRRRV